MPDEPQDDTIERSLRAIVPKLPKAVRFRAQNALDGIDKTFALLPIDREIASFRAITAEEEAVTALIKAIEFRGYPHSKRLNARMHTHKTAVMLCADMVRRSFAKASPKLVVTFDIDQARIDVKWDIGVNLPGVGPVALQPVEPLGFVIAKPGVGDEPGEVDLFDRELGQIVAENGKGSANELIKFLANQRNHLLYASDNALPLSQATVASLAARKQKVLALIAASVMVLQSHDHLPTVRQAIDAVLDMIGNLPSDRAATGLDARKQTL